MSEAARKATEVLPTLRPLSAPSVADRVMEALQERILSLELPPQTRISEAEVARQMGVSRQPVREAFKRLEKLGFLRIRPQSSTTVTLISESAVERARFIRTALEAHTCRTACSRIDAAGLAALSDLLAGQKAAIAAGDRARFHALDDMFHREICRQAGADYVWDMIHDSKAHMDRIRMLSLNTTSQQLAYGEHVALFEAIAARNPDAAAAAITKHLDRIRVLIEEVKSLDHSWFEDAEP
jgi:GntR family transcriptional regulator, rspAB operon transcriptional repressor